MKRLHNFNFYRLSFMISLMLCFAFSKAQDGEVNKRNEKDLPFISFSNPDIHYAGRIDKSQADHYKFSAPGVYIMAKFRGTNCSFDLAAEGDKNYIEIVVDDKAPERMLVGSARKTYQTASGLSDGEHTVLICKDTEAGMGSLLFYGFRVKELIRFSEPLRKIECFGNSITCGAKMITGELCEQTSNWNAPNKAYASYGALTARALNAQYHLTSVSGIGLIHSCCGMTNTMPTTYDRLFLENAQSPKWDFNKYVPDVVTICLGQNDGALVVLSDEFIYRYITFIKTLKTNYPSASFFLLTSPMADDYLFTSMTTTLEKVIKQLNAEGVTNIYKVELPHNLTHGCQSHPNEEEHKIVADVLTRTIKEMMGW